MIKVWWNLFNNDFIANLAVSWPVKEFRKSVSIWHSYGQSLVFYFLVHGAV